MKYKIKVNPNTRGAYIKKDIVEDLGHVWTMVPNSNVAVVYTKDLDLRKVIRGVEVILMNLKLKLEEQSP